MKHPYESPELKELSPVDPRVLQIRAKLWNQNEPRDSVDGEDERLAKLLLQVVEDVRRIEAEARHVEGEVVVKALSEVTKFVIATQAALATQATLLKELAAAFEQRGRR